MKKILALILSAIMLTASLYSCGNGNETKDTQMDTGKNGGSEAFEGAISPISREDGSGTRGAFIELFGIEQKDESGEKVDHTISSSEITNSTSVMMTTVAGNKYALGYISLGSLNNKVKALKIDGAEATVENIKSGEYKISRPFNIATKGDVSEAAADFISFIMSADGQKVVEAGGYISEGNEGSYKSSGVSGNITISGSSSVTPVMEKLKEAYVKINSSVKIEIQQSDSSTGMKDVISGTSDIGMASRELKESEISEGAEATVIALDGIAVIVNNDCPINSLTSEQVRKIYMGDITDWKEIDG